MSEVGVHQIDTEEDQKPFGHVKAPSQKSRAVVRKQSAETGLCVGASAEERPSPEYGGQRTRKNMEEPSLVGPCTCEITSVEQRASSSSNLWRL